VRELNTGNGLIRFGDDTTEDNDNDTGEETQTAMPVPVHIPSGASVTGNVPASNTIMPGKKKKRMSPRVNTISLPLLPIDEQVLP